MSVSAIEISKPVVLRSGLRKLPFKLTPEFKLYDKTCLERTLIESYIYDKFKEVYMADISHYLPYLLALRCQGRLSGVVGCSFANRNPLYLEQYLNSTIEQEIEMMCGLEVDRSEIVEIGNLTVTRFGSGQLIFLFLTLFLKELGREWVVFTGTREVERLLDRMGFSPTLICNAEAKKLVDDSTNWGSYYRESPQVLFCRISEVADTISNNSLMRNIAERLKPCVSTVISQWF